MPTNFTQTDLAKPEVFGTRLAAGTVPAEKQPDGTIRVRGLPFFSEIRADDPGVKLGLREPRDRAWLETALRKHQARRVLGEKPAMNLRHIFDNPERVGEYELTHVELAQVNPDEAPRCTLFGDKIYENEQAFQKAMNHDYRSAEISPDSPSELSALALLRDKMSFHRYPNVKERLAPQLVEAFEAWSGKGGTFQVWQGGVETFESAAPSTYASARDPYAVANAMLQKGHISKAQFDDVVSAIKRESNETTKEGAMPADTKTDEKKAPSVEERMEAMASKFFETMSKKFEAMMASYGDKGEKKETAKQETKEAGGTEEPSGKKPESAESKPEEKKESKGPDATPAIHQAATPETFAATAAKNGIGLLSEGEKMELLGLRSYVQRKQKEEQVESFALAGEQALVSGGVMLDDSVRSMLREKAKESGKFGVEGVVSGILHYAKNAARAPETFGVLAAGAAPSSIQDPDLKKAVETFGAKPDVRQKVMELYGSYRDMDQTFRRAVPFFDVCNGHPEINPSILEPRGGLQRKA